VTDKLTPVPTQAKYDKTYVVRLSDKEMAALAQCVAAYFNKLTAEQKTIPVNIAEYVTNALYKMREASTKNAILTAVD
jgi:DNA mismatch repair protein MutH